MKNIFTMAFVVVSYTASTQERGNAIYDYGNNAYAANQVYGNYGYNPYNVSGQGNYNTYLPNDSVYTIGARVMINVQPDAYIAVFSVQQEALTVAECNQKITVRINAFTEGMKTAGIKEDDIFVDLIAQTRIYDYKISGKTATETCQGFELKKNIIIKFTQHALLEKLMLLASEQQIYDIVKIDYIVLNPEKYQDELRRAALEIIEKKKSFITANASLQLGDKGVIQNENTDMIFPNQAYRQYTAAESARVMPSYYNSETWVKEQRKSKTFYFEKQNPSHYDRIIDAGMVKIPVQISLEINVKFYIGKPEKKTRK